MEKVIEFTVMFVLGEAASYAQSRFSLPEFADRTLDKLFQLNAIERGVDGLSHQLEETRELVGQLLLGKRRDRINVWSGKACTSKSTKVRNNEDVVKFVAALVCSLEESEVQELVIHDSKNSTATISQAIFNSDERNTEETLKSIVNIATSDSLVERVEAYGFKGQYEVVSEKCAKYRSQFIIDLANLLSLKWDGPSSTDPDPDSRKKHLWQLKKKLRTSWILDGMKQNIVNFLKTDTFEKLAKRVDGSRSQDSRILNVFIVGSERTGKSTTSFLLSGKGREQHDAISSLRKPTRSISVEEVEFEDRRIMLWDTPGLNAGESLNRVRQRSLRDKLKAVSGISAVIFQTTINGYNSKQEVSIISMLNEWLQFPLRQNLIIAFKAGPGSKDREEREKQREQNVKNWECALDLSGVGKIGASNYVHFDAPDISPANWKEVCALNGSAVEVVKGIIKNKVISTDKVSWNASEEILQCKDAEDSKRKEELKMLYQLEFSSDLTDHIRSVLEGARKLHASMEKRVREDLVFTVRSGRIISAPFRFAKRLCTKSPKQDFQLRATGTLSQNMVREILPEPKQTRSARRKSDNILSRSREKYQLVDKGCQKLDQWRRRDSTETWVETICSGSFQFYRHDVEFVKRPIYLVFERDCYVTEQAIDILLKHLGGSVTLELLNLTSESNESDEDNSSSSQRGAYSDGDLVDRRNCLGLIHGPRPLQAVER